MNVLNETVSERFAMYQGDCVQTLEGLPELRHQDPRHGLPDLRG